MADEELKFPAQSQDTQPGKQYLMHPLPISVDPQYKPSNKLHVRPTFSFFLFFYLYYIYYFYSHST